MQRSDDFDRNNQAFCLENLTVQPGTRLNGFLRLADGKFELPVTILHGAKKGKTVLITAGVHAAEYVGIQAAVLLAEKLSVQKIRGTVIIVKVVNREAFENRTGSFGMHDGVNLNRVFPGDPNGSEMEQLAWEIATKIQPAADYYIDLHSGDDYEKLAPYVYFAGKAEEKTVAMSRKMAEQVDVPYMVRSMVGGGGSYNYAASRGIPSILIERGGMGAWTMEEVQSTRRDVRNILCSLGVYEGERDYRMYYPLEVAEVRYLAATYMGLWHPRKEPGDMVKAGEVLGVVQDYEGKILEIYEAEFDGVILYETGSLQVVEQGPVVAYGKIVRHLDDRKERIMEYWTKRSDSFSVQKKAELESPLAEKWAREISRQLPEGKKLKILDVGCGTGFFTILLAKIGHEVTGTDLTPEMIVHSRRLAKEARTECKFLVMDAEKLDFADETFDVVISRNLIWNLPHAEEAYGEWRRVLKKGGILLNFDANYGASDFAETRELPKNHAHHQVGKELMRECEEIKKQLPVSAHVRPSWDLYILGKMGMENFSIDLGISGRIYTEKDEFYNPTPMFMIRAVK